MIVSESGPVPLVQCCAYNSVTGVFAMALINCFAFLCEKSRSIHNQSWRRFYSFCVNPENVARN